MNLNKISFMSQAHFDEMGSTEDQNISLVGGVAVAGTKKDAIPMTLNAEATLTAPEDGYISLKGTTSGGACYIYNTTTGIGTHLPNSNGAFKLNLRVAKGDVSVLAQVNGTLGEAAFYYDK